MDMQYINKPLYDALKAAKVEESLATEAATADRETEKNIAKLDARLIIVERLTFGVAVGVALLLIRAYLPY